MPAVSMRELLVAALRGGYAVGAFNILDYASMRAVIDAAGELKAPVIIQTSPKTIDLWGCEAIASWYRQLTKTTRIPAVLHLDHCRNLAMISRCIEAGWTSVMIDASSLPFEENLHLTMQVVDLARVRNVSVEAELGEIGGVEDDISVPETRLVDPEKAGRFCESAKVDCLAPAIGTAHGIYKGVPVLAFDRLEAVKRITGLPLALHGGTGLSADVFRRCIGLGVAKINISTQIKHAFIDGFVGYYAAHSQEYNPLKPVASQMERIRADVASFIGLFGSEAKA